MKCGTSYLAIVWVLVLAVTSAADQHTSDILQSIGHSVSRLTDRQEFELVVDRLVKDIKCGNYKALRAGGPPLAVGFNIIFPKRIAQ